MCRPSRSVSTWVNLGSPNFSNCRDCARRMSTSCRMMRRESGSKNRRTSGPSRPKVNEMTVCTSVSVAVTGVHCEVMMKWRAGPKS